MKYGKDHMSTALSEAAKDMRSSPRRPLVEPEGEAEDECTCPKCGHTGPCDEFEAEPRDMADHEVDPGHGDHAYGTTE